MTDTMTWTELIWAVTGLIGVWAAWLLWRRTLRQVRVADDWAKEAALAARYEDELVDAESTRITSRDRRDRNFGLVVIQAIFLIVSVGAAMRSETSESARATAQIGLTIAQIIMVTNAWQSVRSGDRAMRLLRRGRSSAKRRGSLS